MCCETTNAQGGASAKAPKSCISAEGPPVEAPIATTREAALAPAGDRTRQGALEICRRSLSMRSCRIAWTLRISSCSIVASSGVARGLGFATKSTAPSSSALKTS
jgi:hypothetical protein